MLNKRATANMLKVSEAASLAMHAAVLLAASNGQPRSTRKIANALNASEHHLAKVLQRLARAGLVVALRGPAGGFKLATAPGRITLLDVYEAIEGKLAGQPRCLFAQPVCSGKRCILGNLLRTVTAEVRRHLANTKLSELLDLYQVSRTKTATHKQMQ